VSLGIDRAVFKGKGGVTLPELPQVTFPAVSQEDPQKLATTLSLLGGAAFMSIETGVRRVHANDNWSDPQVDEEVTRIMREKGMQVTDPANLDRTPATQQQLQDALDKVGQAES